MKRDFYNQPIAKFLVHAIAWRRLACMEVGCCAEELLSYIVADL